MAEIQATNNFVFVIETPPEEERNGLYIPGSGRDKPNTGKIFSIGGMVKDPKIKGGKNKTCMFHKGVGFHIDYLGVSYLVLSGEEIIAVL